MWKETNLLAQHLEKGKKPEIAEAQDARTEGIFSEFDLHLEKQLETRNDFYYHELQKKDNPHEQESGGLTLEQKREVEFETLCDCYADPENYRGIFKRVPWLRKGVNSLTFAMKWMNNPETYERFKSDPSPGQVALGDAFDDSALREQLLEEGNLEEYKQYVVKMLNGDLACEGKEVVEVDTPDYKTNRGEWLIAMVSQDGMLEKGPDFHFYIRGDYGTWYHKQGALDPSRVDASGKEIFDPKTCDRGIYDVFHGYFVVRDKRYSNYI